MAKRYELSDGFVAQRVIAEWIDFYNTERPDSALRRSDTGRGLWHQGPVDMTDKAIALPTSPQAQQQQQVMKNRFLAA